MTEPLYQSDPYLRDCEARVESVDGERIVLDRSVFYPRGGGQPGDAGTLHDREGGETTIVDTVHGDAGAIVLVAAAPVSLAPGDELRAEIDWNRRHAHMRMHTGLHLLGAVLPYGVTGGAITAERSRLDFDMQEPIDRESTEAALNALVAEDHPVETRWITQEELAAQPELVRTMSVRPPANVPRIRLLEIPGVDLQPCGGTHVRRTGEIGPLRILKVEKKGRRNRRVVIGFAA